MNASEAYRFILNNPYGSIFITDSKGNIVFVNRGTEKLLGRKRAELIGSNVRQFLREGIYDRSTVLECITNKKLIVGQLKLGDGNSIMSVSIPIVNKDGVVLATITNSLDNSIVSDYMAELAKERQKSRTYRETIQYLFDIEKPSGQIIANSSSMKKIINMARRIAGTDCNILILGE